VFLHLLAREGLDDQFVVDSAGTGSWHVGKPADRRMLAAAERRGIALPSRARQIEAADLGRFDRILTMDNDNLAAVAAMARRSPAVAQELALIEPITRHCRQFGLEEVPDPYYGGEDGFEQVLDLLEDACSGLLDELKPR
jgi:protein-tyrosine phosphatase